MSTIQFFDRTSSTPIETADFYVQDGNFFLSNGYRLLPLSSQDDSKPTGYMIHPHDLFEFNTYLGQGMFPDCFFSFLPKSQSIVPSPPNPSS
jgi:hypothetical protein